MENKTFKHLKTFKLFGMKHSELEDFFANLNETYNNAAHVDFACRNYDAKLSIRFDSENILNHIAFDIINNFKENIYSDKNITLEKCLFEYLKFQKKILSVAESLTGGCICDRMISIEGASSVFFEGLVVYSNESKMNRLGVKANTLKNFGAVSDEACYEMAAGLLSGDCCDISIATTGIAGPTGFSEKKPLGLTYIGIGSKEGIHIYKHIFEGNRQEIRQSAADFALFYTINHLKGVGEMKNLRI